MKTYEVEVTEVRVWYEDVEAESEEHAQRLAIEEIEEGRGYSWGDHHFVVTNTTVEDAPLQGEL